MPSKKNVRRKPFVEGLKSTRPPRMTFDEADYDKPKSTRIVDEVHRIIENEPIVQNRVGAEISRRTRDPEVARVLGFQYNSAESASRAILSALEEYVRWGIPASVYRAPVPKREKVYLLHRTDGVYAGRGSAEEDPFFFPLPKTILDQLVYVIREAGRPLSATEAARAIRARFPDAASSAKALYLPIRNAIEEDGGARVVYRDKLIHLVGEKK